ncbi:methyltransferase domain-containing protein [Flavobacterium sangjuense]|uniref:Uncharacterized protein n=1 Tax=Flavobacterium sangjuense TaxID=2518177 RepID=A0A4P7PRP9_9FLAO|nr:methyltransferase domain-containing protein [Flavobacterium sangjuense]QBZ96850.1 hypothetical protein GS03_00333 [Flavobacterium sangjuense]
MNWKIKAGLQKLLALTKIGDRLNHIPATLDKKYHSNVVLYQTHECIRQFSYSNIDLSSPKTALEIGTGYSLISTVVLSLLGFQKIITVDITNDLKFSTFKKQVQHLENPENLEKIVAKSIFPVDVIKHKIKLIKEAKSFSALFDLLNITYVAPYTFEAIENESAAFDYITSLVVLEHVPPKILETLFEKTKKWLSKDGFCVHTINFIDHFANPGFFQDRSISEFNFLKYSDSYWNSWSGNPIAYTNRLSYLFYLELCDKHELNVVDFIGENYRERKDLDLNLIHNDILRKYRTLPQKEDLVKFQRGTLISKA